MTLLHEAFDDKNYDVRLVERNVTRGVVSSDDVEKAVKKLADDSANAEWVSIEELAKAEVGSNGAHH